MGELRHRLVIDLVGNLERRSRRFSDATDRMARRHNRSLKSMSRTSAQVFARMERSAARYSRWIGVAVGAATVAATREVAKFDDQVRQMGVNAGKNGQELETWTNKAKASIRETAIEWGVASDEIEKMMAQVINLTGDMKFAEAAKEPAAAFVRAYDVAGKEVADILKGFYETGVHTTEELEKRLEIVAGIGQRGSFTPQDFAQYGAQITAAYNPKDDKQTAEMVAALQFINDGLADSARTTSSFMALLRVFQDEKKVKEMEKAGFKVYEKDGKTLKPIMDIIANLVAASDGNTKRLQGVVQESEAMRALIPFINRYNEAMKTSANWHEAEAKLRAQMSEMASTKGFGGMVREDARDMQKGPGAALTKLKEIINQFADKNLTAVIDKFGEWTNNLDPEAVTSFLTAIRNATIGLVGLWGAMKVGKVVKGAWNAGKWVKGLFGGAAKGSPMAALAGVGGAMPVRVVNSPIDKHVNDYLGGGNNKGGRGRFGKMGKAMRTGGRLLGAAGAVYSAWEIGQAIGEQINESLIQGTHFQDQLGEFLTHVAALAGSDEAKETLRLKEKQWQQQREQYIASQAISTEDYRKLLELRQSPEAEQKAVVSTLSTQLQQVWRDRVSKLPQEAVNASLQSMRALSTETANATANALTNALRNTPGTLDVKISVNDGRTSVTASPVTNPAGFRINTHNTQEKMRNGM